MSASRDVVASVNGISPNFCNCKHCANRKKFLRYIKKDRTCEDALWCSVFGGVIYPNSFCSFFEPEEDV